LDLHREEGRARGSKTLDYKEVMSELKSMGTAQNRKIYARHGVRQKMYGVSYANLGKLKKKIKMDHDLALELWASGNHDARVLATMIADPNSLDARTLEAWVKELDNYVITDAFSGIVAQTSLLRNNMEKWTKSNQEWIGSAGWNLLGYLAGQNSDLPDKYFIVYLKNIEAGIHDSPNRVRHAMNGAVINIGLRNESLEKKATASAKRIGKVEVDHGETSCKTPDAASYILKAKAHRRKRRR
jgi:3-methyladenine DNA glycosylase AlkD